MFAFLCLFQFFSTKPRDWLGRTSPKWSVLCRVGCKIVTQSNLGARDNYLFTFFYIQSYFVTFEVLKHYEKIYHSILDKWQCRMCLLAAWHKHFVCQSEMMICMMTTGAHTTLTMSTTIQRQVGLVIRAATEMMIHRHLHPDENIATQTPATLIGGKKCLLLTKCDSCIIYTFSTYYAGTGWSCVM